MKILVVCPYFPYPLLSGGAVRVYNILKTLGRSHEITLLCLSRKPVSARHLERVRRHCRRVEVFPRRPGRAARCLLRSLVSSRSLLEVVYCSAALRKRLVELLVSDPPDLLQVEHFYSTGNLPARISVPSLLIEHNIESEVYLGYQRWHAPTWIKPLVAWDCRKIERNQQRAWTRFSACAAVSPVDQRTIARTCPALPVGLVPNAVGDAFLEPRRAGPGPDHRLVFVGNFRYVCNVDAMLHLGDRYWPAIRARFPEMELAIVGASPPPAVRRLARRPGITVTGRVADTRTFLEQACAFAAPLRYGSGTKLKILEALAMGLPVVCSSVGAQGIELGPREGLFVADDPATFVDQLERLLADRANWTRTSRAAREAVRGAYRWSQSVRRLEALYDCCIPGRGARQAPREHAPVGAPAEDHLGATSSSASSR